MIGIFVLIVISFIAVPIRAEYVLLKSVSEVVVVFETILKDIAHYLLGFVNDGCQTVPVEHRAIALEKKLDSHLFGQKRAVQLIRYSFENHDYQKPLSIHIVGENGVGKSYSAKLIRDAFFNRETCSLFLRGSNFEANKPDEYIPELRFQMVKYLSTNPKGLVIVDEFSSFHPSVVPVFTNFLDTTISNVQQYKNIKCDVKGATFIFISDFGAENYDDSTELSDAISSVQIDQYSKFQSIKQISVIKNVIPFDFINYNGVYQLVKHNLNRLDQLVPNLKLVNFTLQKNLDKFLTDHLYEISIKYHRYENYRGFLDKVFDKHFLFPLSQKLYSTPNLTELDNVHIFWNFQESQIDRLVQHNHQ